ncbi:hypothetical protein HYS00_02670 [Candidatus Microgenomates bacterium]|nr:hypothetical protein [Candidatus Microgenomates bacterium]
MSRSAEFIRPLAKATAVATAAGAAFGVAQSIGVTIEHHRRRAHQSLDPHPAISKTVRFVENTTAVESSSWAAVHRELHHGHADASLSPFMNVARAIHWVEEHPDEAGDIEIPESFPHLDPYVDAFSRDDVLTIGGHAIESLQDRMGDQYQPPETYSREQLDTLFHPEEPQYYYKMEPPKKDGDYSYEETEAILLRDPHSPILIPPDKKGHQNGLRGVYKYNVPLFQHPRNLFKKHPEFKPVDLRDPELSTAQKAAAWTAGFLIASGAVFAARRDFSRKGVVIAAAAGSAANLARIPTYLNGGKITNAAGHFGPMDEQKLEEALFSRDSLPELNRDGSVSTNTVRAGILGKALGVLTLDEVGGQGDHHDYPENIPYTTKTGWEGFKEAPFGTVTKMIAESRLPFLNEGKQFDGIAKKDRPDMPTPGVLLIQRRRAEQRFGSHPDYPSDAA